VFETKDGGPHWTDLSGNLPDAPGDALVVHDGTMFLTTDVGVFVATVAAPTVVVAGGQRPAERAGQTT